eukprot:TRINITY_DN886_c0_g1_i1.p1 TRINITY_DN886_c0_g1~~TRINITY_DN886_c0_g1_i1.p1  ORF type:complete len:689 (+),score=201.55 TRINITY_DN886_c0_g1_i1:3-2069(+)
MSDKKSVAADPEYWAPRSALFDKFFAEQQAQKAEEAKKCAAVDVAVVVGGAKIATVQALPYADNAFAILKKALDSQQITKEVMDKAVVCKVNGVEQDLSRALEVKESPVTLELFSFDDAEGKHVFWHSSAHVLGQALEKKYHTVLNVGPATDSNFFYDSKLPGGAQVALEDCKEITTIANHISKAKQPFQRIEVSPAQAMEMFGYNPFKVAIIQKVPETEKISVYKCGPLIDLCRGPHVPNTGYIKAFTATAVSSCYADGTSEGEVLQRVYGISFPSKEQMQDYEKLLAEAAKRDHRNIGKQQELFFFHPYSPGSAFWLPHGYRIFRKLIAFIQDEYRKRNYQEVLTPNVFSSKLWETSGHWAHYKDNMFSFKCEEQIMGLKPMNCPGHCLVFQNRTRSYRELPIRMAEFGVLHRNELSGALHGLTRVRRFQQDDAHIFCRVSQIKQEVEGALDFVKRVYGVFEMPIRLELSTRPEHFLGEIEVWNKAEEELKDVLNASGFNWKLNPGDGAFYGPKIDIHVQDALKRFHQCATVQLDFQLPIRFDLTYMAEESGKVERPVMVHRAILGSLERFIGVLTEHTAGKWPFWISPRQVCIVPVTDKHNEYAKNVAKQIHEAGFYVDVDDSANKMQKKIAEAQTSQYNFILVVGQEEMDKNTVNVRTRENVVRGSLSLPEFISEIKKIAEEFK